MIKSISFVDKGKEPKALRTSHVVQEVQQVLEKIKELPPGKSLTVEFDTKYPYKFLKTIKAAVNPKVFSVYRTRNIVVIKSLK
jgi:hypothetical protein